MVVTSSIICTSFLLHFLGEQYGVSLLPKGNCAICCSTDLKNDIKFYAFKQNHPNLPYELSNSDFEYNMKIYNGSKSNVFYVHGFSEHYNGAASFQLKNALLKIGCVVTIVDWSPLTTMPWYDQSIKNMEIVGKYVAEWLELMVSHGLPLRTIHLVGFSLGTEVAGYIGHFFRSGKIPRITALDPAHGVNTPPTIGRRLSLTDADFIDVIHTDSGPLGFLSPHGHVDFFPNMGTAPQPGCTIEEIFKEGRLWELVACSHNRAWRYFIESIEYPYSFPAIAMGIHQGQNVIEYMGMVCSKRSRGMYYLSTNKSKLYGQGPQSHYFDPF